MMTRSSTSVFFCATVLLLAGSAPLAAAEVSVHGATTVAFGLFKPKKDEIEKSAGVTLNILPSSTTRGLADLAEKKVDIAMLAEPLQSAAESVNKSNPGLV